MRRTDLTSLALIALALAAATTPSRAQWWGRAPPGVVACGPWACPARGWARPGPAVVFAPPRRPWMALGEFGEQRFWAWRRWTWQRAAWQRWAWQRWAWRREVRSRRIENWHRWVEADRRAAEPRTAWSEPPREARFRGWTGWSRPAEPAPRRPAPAEAAVALASVPAPRAARAAFHAASPSRILAAVAAIRRPVVPGARRDAGPAVDPVALRVPEPPNRPTNAGLRRPHRAAPRGAFPARDLRPVALRSQPPAQEPAAPPQPAALPQPAAPETRAAAPADVPVAPLD